jgi:RNA-directed DNA polymerase
MRGWCNYFRYGVSKNTFSYVGAYSWYRVVRWIRRHHHGLNWKELRRRVFTGKWGIVADGIELFEPAKVPVTRYRYRGAQIPTPWTPHAHSATA